MNIIFNIEYKAEWGENLYLIGNISEKVYWNLENPILMTCHNERFWTTQINIPNNTKKIRYKYFIKKKDDSIILEQGSKREIHLSSNKEIQILDKWRSFSNEKPFNSAVFSDVFCIRKNKKKPSYNGNIQFSIYIPYVKSNHGVAIVGNIPELGEWDINKKIKLSDYYYPYWNLEIELTNNYKQIEYKYIIYNLETESITEYEEGKNRKLNDIQIGNKTIVADINFYKSIPIWKTTGTAIPIFSLRSENDLGIGEFFDLKLLIDWAKKTKQKIIQILPINDTTSNHNYLDSYPYNAISVFAINPIYINIEAIGSFNDKTLLNKYKNTQKLLNSKTSVDYQAVATEKDFFLNILYKKYSPSLFKTKEYKNFFNKNEYWLTSYSAFCVLRDKFKTSNFEEWEKFKTYNKNKINEYITSSKEIKEKIEYNYFVQYHLDKQFKEVRDYAHSQGIALKGDIPIGINSHSAETWSKPELFNLKVQAGAPPDDFATTGQNWGFPTFNWDIMAKDHYEWWKKRFIKMTDYFDAYRIDHILGFFRIWEIPKDDIWGLKGRFSPALPYTYNDLKYLGTNLTLKRLTEPFIHLSYLPDLFGDKTKDVINQFLTSYNDELYSFKEEYNSQRKIENYFNSHNLKDKESQKIKEGLFTLDCEVLFVKDLKNPKLLHPRISNYDTNSFKYLDDNNKQIIYNIHNDFFYIRHNDFWKRSALTKLPLLLKTNNMLACGEDLGMVPQSVPEVMKDLKILSLEVQRMPKKFGKEFGKPKNYPYLSVATTGTHDMNPLRAWWEEDANKTQHYYNNILGHQYTAPQTCNSEIASEVISMHLSSSSMFVILPIQDWLALSDKLKRENPNEERINVPNNPKNYWCYRLHLTLEQLLNENEFNKQIAQRIISIGR